MASNCPPPSPVGAADPCGPLVWDSGMFRFVVPRGRLRAAEVCGPYEKWYGPIYCQCFNFGSIASK